MVTAILLFGSIKTEVVLLDFGLVYFRAIQYLFLSFGRIWAGFDDFSMPFKKLCQYSLLALSTIQ